MATVRVQEWANEVRIEILGRFAGECVAEVCHEWERRLQASHQRLSVDISGLAGYDARGRKLLRDMYHHGMNFVGSTPDALAFLSEIAMPAKAGGLTQMPEQGGTNAPESKPVQSSSTASGKSASTARAGAGGMRQ